MFLCDFVEKMISKCKIYNVIIIISSNSVGWICLLNRTINIFCFSWICNFLSDFLNFVVCVGVLGTSWSLNPADWPPPTKGHFFGNKCLRKMMPFVNHNEGKPSSPTSSGLPQPQPSAPFEWTMELTAELMESIVMDKKANGRIFQVNRSKLIKNI